MAFLRPSSDVSTGLWTNEAGGTTLYSSLDETSAGDSDYIQSGPWPLADTAEMHLSDPTGVGINAAGFVIHSAVHMGRPDVRCVMHTHTAAGMAVSTHPEGLLPITQHAMRFHQRIARHPYEGIAIDLAERERLVKDLGDHNAMILENHGLLTCGRTVAEAFGAMYYLERACQAQVAALSGGVAPLRASPEAIERTAQILHDNRHKADTRDWPPLLRMLDRIDPSYRT